MVPSVRGTLILNMIEAMRAEYGPPVVERALARLDPESRDVLEQATPLSWVANDAQDQFFRALANETGQTVEQLVDDYVPKATARAFSSVWRIFFRAISPRALVTRTSAIFSKTRNVGRLSVAGGVRGRARLELTGWPRASEIQLRSTALAIQTVLQVAGRPHARCTYDRTPDGCTFDLVWRASNEVAE